MPEVLLTGATGHVGGALLPELLADPAQRVLCLVRARDADHLEQRRQALVRAAGLADDGRLRAVRGDVSAPGLGLAPEDRARILAEVDTLLHSAASVRFDLPEDDAARRNVEGTEAVLALARELAEAGRLSRLDHVSTCYVAGDRRRRFFEFECDVGQRFRNSYEWSKCQAEQRVRAAMADGLPAVIHRPSIVVGDSRTGRTESFNVLYWPLKLYARGWWRTYPGRLDTLVDVVPVDWLARAMVALRRDPGAIGGCFHLAAGEGAVTVGALVERVRSITGGPPLRVVDQGRYLRWVRPLLKPVFLTRRGRQIDRGGRAFMPYFEGNPLFDTTRARAALGEALRPPPVEAYFDQAVRFALAKDFGSR